MTNEEKNKKSWQTPAILDLDVEDKTEGKEITLPNEAISIQGPS